MHFEVKYWIWLHYCKKKREFTFKGSLEISRYNLNIQQHITLYLCLQLLFCQSPTSPDFQDIRVCEVYHKAQTFIFLQKEKNKNNMIKSLLFGKEKGNLERVLLIVIAVVI